MCTAAVLAITHSRLDCVGVPSCAGGCCLLGMHLGAGGEPWRERALSPRRARDKSWSVGVFSFGTSSSFHLIFTFPLVDIMDWI